MFQIRVNGAEMKRLHVDSAMMNPLRFDGAAMKGLRVACALAFALGFARIASQIRTRIRFNGSCGVGLRRFDGSCRGDPVR